MPPLSPQNSNRGLTLIETVAGAAILIILVALLLPIITAMNHRNETIKCLGHLQHMHSGFIAYTNDHNGSLPPYRENWPQEDGTTLRGDFWSTKIKPYLSPDKKYFKCPAEKVIPSNHYGMNVGISPGGALKPEKISNTNLPSKRYLLADAVNTTRITATAFTTEGGFRHDHRQINLIFLDGHVESRAVEELPIPANGFKKTDADYKAFFSGTL